MDFLLIWWILSGWCHIEVVHGLFYSLIAVVVYKWMCPDKLTVDCDKAHDDD